MLRIEEMFIFLSYLLVCFFLFARPIQVDDAPTVAYSFVALTKVSRHCFARARARALVLRRLCRRSPSPPSGQAVGSLNFRPSNARGRQTLQMCDSFNRRRCTSGRKSKYKLVVSDHHHYEPHTAVLTSTSSSLKTDEQTD